MSLDSFDLRATLSIGSEQFDYFSLPALESKLGMAIARLPYSLKILLENLIRREDGAFVKAADIRALASWTPEAATKEISFMPARARTGFPPTRSPRA